MNIFIVIIRCFVVLLPWKLKWWVLNKFFHYQIHPKAHIGLSYIFPRHLIMEEGAKIGHLNVAIHLDKMILKKNSIIDRGNWITGFPTGTTSRHFSHNKDRKSELIIGCEAAITKNHHLDCTDSVQIGDFTTIAGYNSQLLTHSINIYDGCQDCHPITIGDYCFVSTGVKILGGSHLPDYSVLGAGAVLNKQYVDTYRLYAGVPARSVKDINKDAKYFNRLSGFVI